MIGLRLPSGKNNDNNDDDDSGGFGNMDFISGKPSFLPPQRTAIPVKKKGVNDLWVLLQEHLGKKQMI